MSMLTRSMVHHIPRQGRSALGAFAIAATLMAPLPALAEIDADGIVADAQQALDNFVKASEGALQPAGPITYVRDGGNVIVTMPALVLDTPPTRFDIPAAVLRLWEVDAKQIGYEIELPTEILGQKVAPAVPDELRLTIGAQNIAGTFLRDLAPYGTLKAELSDIRLTSGEGGFTLGGFSVVSDTVENGPGNWDSSGGYLLNDLTLTGPDGQSVAAIAEFGAGMDATHVDLPRYMEFSQRMTAAAMPDGPGGKVNEAEAQAAALELVETLPDMMDGASGSFYVRAAGIKVMLPHEPPFDLSSASIAMDLKPSGKTYDLGIGLAFNEPTIDPSALPAPTELIPQKLNAALALRQIPIATFWQMVADPLREEIKGDPSGAAADQLEMAPMMAMGAAAEAGTFAEIEGLELIVGPATLNAKGVGPIMPGSPQPPLKVDMSIEGLDALVKVAQGLAPDMSQQITPLVLMVRGLGQPKAANNEIVYEYLIEQGPKGPGDILINGVSIGDMQPQ